MTIGVDIDDTITNSSELITEYAKKHFKSDDISLINNILHASKIDSELLNFYKHYSLEMMMNYALKDDVKEVINRLRQNGHKIVIITARGYTLDNGVIEITEDYFKKHEVLVDKIIFKAKYKAQACIENNIDLMVDDSVEVLKEIKEIGIETILFTSISNKNIKTDINRIENWLALEKYINNLCIDKY